MSIWSKTYDAEAGYYTFTHVQTAECQCHKPWGMGLADLWMCQQDKVDDGLLKLFLRIGVRLRVCFLNHHVSSIMSLCNQCLMIKRQVWHAKRHYLQFPASEGAKQGVALSADKWTTRQSR